MSILAFIKSLFATTAPTKGQTYGIGKEQFTVCCKSNWVPNGFECPYCRQIA